MAHPIRMPKPGQMTEECVLTTWHKQVGDPVRRGDILFEIETDKSAMEVEAFDDGVLLARLVEEGEAVPVNAICGYVGAAGEAIPEEALVAAAAEPVAAAPAPPVAVPGMASAPVPVRAPRASSDEALRFRISPRASRLAAEAGLDPRTITGSGPEGRIIERDVQAAVEGGAAANAARPGPAPAPPQAPAPLHVAPVEGEEEPRPLSRMRRVIADRLTHSWQATPHFTVTVAVDVTRLLGLRAELRVGGTNLTITDFVLAATARTLAEFPDVNSRTDGASVWSRRRVHLGLAVSLPAGLVVPVIRDADRLGLGELHDRAAALAGAAREGTLPLDDMTGGTFTVSNLGMFGVDEFSAIINPGEAAILAVASAIPTVVAVGDAMGIRPIMKLTLSADHRLVDGETGARFLNAIRRRLEDVAAFRSEALNG
jgi:pyruvate dehydrogenase E2 component (dihydrolipoamide acetyltransferase)